MGLEISRFPESLSEVVQAAALSGALNIGETYHLARLQMTQAASKISFELCINAAQLTDSGNQVIIFRIDTPAVFLYWRSLRGLAK